MPTLTPDDVLDPALGLRLLSAIVQGFDGYLTFVDRQRRILYMSRMVSRDPRETLGSLLEEYIAPQHREQSVYWLERAFETKQPQQHEFDALLADGSQRA